MRHCWLEPGLLWRSGIKKLPLDGDTYIGEDLLSSIWAHETTLEHHQPIPSKYHELVGTFKLHIAMAAPIWDPKRLLNVYPDSNSFSCVATTKKGSRCKLRPSAADRAAASGILDNMSFYDPRTARVSGYLSDLASLIQCGRWHKKPGYSQVRDLVRDWQAIVEDAFAPINRIRTIAATSNSSSTRSPSSILAENSSISALRNNSTASVQPRIGRLTPTTSQSRSPTLSISTAFNIPSSNSAPDLPSPPATPTQASRNTRTSPAPFSTTSESSQASLDHGQHTSDVAQTESSAQAPLTPPPSPCPDSKHATKRKPITESCGICYDPICCLEDTVWCRGQCGQNIHRACFGIWRKHCLKLAVERRMNVDDVESDDEADEAEELDSLSKAVTCPFCRCRWKAEFED